MTGVFCIGLDADGADLSGSLIRFEFFEKHQELAVGDGAAGVLGDGNGKDVDTRDTLDRSNLGDATGGLCCSAQC